MVDWVVEPFEKRHDRAGFASGKAALDDFLRSQMSQYQKRRLGQTFVAVSRGGVKVLGYYTLAAGAVPFDHLPTDAARKMPRHPVPAILLARLAVDQSAQGARLGEGLLFDALQRSVAISASLGVHAVELDAIDDAAAGFYRKYGFTPLLDNPLHLYLPMTTVEDMFV